MDVRIGLPFQYSLRVLLLIVAACGTLTGASTGLLGETVQQATQSILMLALSLAAFLIAIASPILLMGGIWFCWRLTDLGNSSADHQRQRVMHMMQRMPVE